MRFAGALLGSLGLLAAATTPANAKEAGDLLVRARALAVIPDEGGSLALGGTPIAGRPKIRNQVVPELDFSYFLTDQVAAELILATTPHRVSAKGTPLGDADLGKVWLLPPTLTLQYHPFPKAQISPYVGAGINYTIFYGVKSGDTVHIDYKNRFGWALQAGCDIALTEQWSFNIDVKKLFLRTPTSINAGLPALITSKVHIDPVLVGVGFGYRFKT